jgi:hypothetical protein
VLAQITALEGQVDAYEVEQAKTAGLQTAVDNAQAEADKYVEGTVTRTPSILYNTIELKDRRKETGSAFKTYYATAESTVTFTVEGGGDEWRAKVGNGLSIVATKEASTRLGYDVAYGFAALDSASEAAEQEVTAATNNPTVQYNAAVLATPVTPSAKDSFYGESYTTARDAANGNLEQAKSGLETHNVNLGTLESNINTALGTLSGAIEDIKNLRVSVSVLADGIASDGTGTVRFARDGSPKEFPLSFSNVFPIDGGDNADFSNYVWSVKSEGDDILASAKVEKVDGVDVLKLSVMPNTIGTTTVTVTAEFKSPGKIYTGGVIVTPLTFTVSAVDTIVFENESLVVTDPIDSTSNYILSLPAVKNYTGTVTYAFAEGTTLADDRITLTQDGKINIAKDTNADNYAFTIVAKDDTGDTTEVAVAFTVVNKYDDQFYAWRSDLIGIQEQVNTTLALVKSLPTSAENEAYIAALEVLANILGPYDAIWNNGKPQAVISLTKQMAVEGYTTSILGISVTTPSPLKLYYDGIMASWSAFEGQIAPITKLVNAYNDLESHVTNTDYAALTSLDSINEYIQVLNAKYVALDTALSEFAASDSVVVPLIEGVLENTKTLLAGAVDTLWSESVQEQIAALIAANI